MIGIDQIAKYFAGQGAFSQLVCNPNISWGIAVDKFILFPALILALVFLVYFIRRMSFHWSLALILAGALGNVIDRLRYGCVIDFIALKNLPVVGKLPLAEQFPLFNFADVFITLGVVVLSVVLWRK